MRKKFLGTFFLLAATFSMVGCSDDTNLNSEPKSPISSETATPTNKVGLNYNQYMILYSNLANDLQLQNFTKISDYVNHPEIIIINKEDSFNNRENLTDGGEQSNRSTQNRVIYLEKDKGYVLYLDLIYVTNTLGNDMVFWDNPQSNAVKDYPETKLFHENIISFKNVLVKSTLISTKGTPLGPKEIEPVTKELVKYLSNYKLL